MLSTTICLMTLRNERISSRRKQCSDLSRLVQLLLLTLIVGGRRNVAKLSMTLTLNLTSYMAKRSMIQTGILTQM